MTPATCAIAPVPRADASSSAHTAASARHTSSVRRFRATSSQNSPAVAALSRRSRTRAARTSHAPSASVWCGTRNSRHRGPGNRGSDAATSDAAPSAVREATITAAHLAVIRKAKGEEAQLALSTRSASGSWRISRVSESSMPLPILSCGKIEENAMETNTGFVPGELPAPQPTFRGRDDVGVALIFGGMIALCLLTKATCTRLGLLLPEGK